MIEPHNDLPHGLLSPAAQLTDALGKLAEICRGYQLCFNYERGLEVKYAELWPYQATHKLARCAVDGVELCSRRVARNVAIVCPNC